MLPKTSALHWISTALLLHAAEAGAQTELSPTPPESVLSGSLTTSGLIGSPVTNRNWEQIGQIEQVLIDPDQGKITYVILSFVDRDMSVAVPWGALRIQDRGRVHLEMSEDELDNAPRLYRVGSAPDVGLGTTPRLDTGVRDPEPGSLSYAPTGVRRTAFDPGRVGYLDGIVVGKISAPFRGESKQVILILDAGGRSYRVEVAPESYLEMAGVAIQPGDRILVRGADVASEGEPIIVATEVTASGRTLKLRDEKGEPVWSRP